MVNAEIYSRRYDKDRGVLHLNELRNLALERGGKLICDEWRGSTAEYWFQDQAGIFFQMSANSIKRGSWSSSIGLSSEPICRQVMNHLFNAQFLKTRKVLTRVGKYPLELDGYAELPPYRVGFEYQGHQSHQKDAKVIARDVEKQALCAQKGIILVIIERFSDAQRWNSEYVLSHVLEAVVRAFNGAGIEVPALNPDPFLINAKEIHSAVEGIKLLKAIANDNHGALLSTRWMGAGGKYQFAFADGRSFFMTASGLLSRGWPKDPEQYLRLYHEARGEIHLDELRRIAEKNGGKLLDSVWLGASKKYHFAFRDGRVFKTIPSIIKKEWPRDPDLYFKNGIHANRGDIHLRELRQIAEKHGGKLLLDEWRGNRVRYSFQFPDGRRFEAYPQTVRNVWPINADSHFRHRSNAGRNELLLEDLRKIATENGGKLLTSTWLGAKTKHRFQFADGREFDILPGNIKKNGWPCDPDTYFRKGPQKRNMGELFLAEIRSIAEAHGGRLLSAEWLGSNRAHRFAFSDGSEFAIRPTHLKARGWPQSEAGK